MITIRPALRALAALLLACLLAGCGSGSGSRAGGETVPPAPTAGTVAVWASSSDATRKLTRQADLALGEAAPAASTDLVVNPARQDQEIVGYGAAMTDASAQLFQITLNRAQRDELFAELFGRQGLGLSFVRVPIGASDFSTRHYSLDDMPRGQSDPALAKFSMAGAEAAQLPALRAARAVNPELTLMASPWSAPGWMKDTDSLIKGRLKPEHYGAFAAYFVRYLDAMAAGGLPVRYVTAQNEPDFEPENYPGMRLNAPERARFIGAHLGPALAARSQPVGILDWDHNWDKPNEPLAVLADPVAARQVTGIAWHCYAGDVQAMGQVRQAHPDKEVFFTECSGGGWAPEWGKTLGWMIDNLVIAPSRAGSRGSILWNLALDQNSGPHLGGCGNCRGVVTIDTVTRSVTRNVEYYVLGHVSRFVRPGARAIASQGGPAGMIHAAFRNRDGSLVLLVHNAGTAEARLKVRSGSKTFAVTAPAGEVMTLVWSG